MQTEPISDYERERGKPMPSKLHSVTQKHLIIAFHLLSRRIPSSAN